MPKVIIAGCGFLGEAAADLFSGAGWAVLGLCSSEASATRLSARAYEVRALDLSRPLPADPSWQGADVLIHCASTRGGEAEAYRAVYLEGLLNAMTAFHPRRTLFTGSTSVYAQTDGSLVDEESPAEPSLEKGRILRDAEGVALASGGYVARLAGLYGPGRSVLLERIREGRARPDGPGDRWINLIHRDDAARALFHLFSVRAEPGIYNVSDDTPSTQKQLHGWAAEALGQPLPPESETPAPRRRGDSNKRVSNAKLRATGWQPAYPSYRTALPALLA